MDKFRSESTAGMRPCPISYSLLLVPVFSGGSFHPIVLLITHPSVPDFANSLWNVSPSKNGCYTLISKGFRNLGKDSDWLCLRLLVGFKKWLHNSLITPGRELSRLSGVLSQKNSLGTIRFWSLEQTSRDYKRNTHYNSNWVLMWCRN